MNKPVLAVVVAVKEWDPLRLERLAESLRCSRSARELECVVVHCEASPEALLRPRLEGLSRALFLRDEGTGVYAAFDQGRRASLAPYVLFLGGDDFLLPGADDVLERLARGEGPDVVACPVVFGRRGLHAPLKSKYGLILRNWCQQGVFYRRSVLEQHAFDPRYRIQADHKLNLEIAADPRHRVEYADDIVAFFSLDGASSSAPDLAFWRDMPGIVRRAFGPGWGALSLLRRTAGLVLHGPPAKRFQRRGEPGVK